MVTIPKLQTIELFLSNYLTHLVIPSDMKMRVNLNNKTIGKPIAINNPIKREGLTPLVLIIY